MDTSFLATFDEFELTPGDTIVFNYVTHNAWGHYNAISGIYTVPLDGTYRNVYRIQGDDGDETVYPRLLVDGQYVSVGSIIDLHF